MEYLEVTYRLDVAESDLEAFAESVLLEQTVETPRSVAERYPFVRENMMGEIRGLMPDGTGGFLARMALPVTTASVDVAQFLNVLYGNTSLHPAVALVDFDLPPSLRETFSGPDVGLEGIRERMNIYGRPLTCTALKPVGLTVDEIGAMCRRFAEGGVDLIKDDHYWSDHPFCPFEERVEICQRAVDDVAERTGHRAIYVPNLSGTPDQVARQAALAQEKGVGAVMAAPMLLGLPFFNELTRWHVSVPILAHPTLAGTLRIRTETLLGKLFRLYGADAVIFANYGGRFGISKEDCGRIAEELRAPWEPFKTAMPVPAGGMSADRAAELIEFFGVDTMLLVGGSLLEAGDDLTGKTRAFVESVKEAAAQVQNR